MKLFSIKKHYLYGLHFLFGLLLLSPSSLSAWKMQRGATQLDYLAKNADYICRIKVNSIQTERTSLEGQGSQFNWVMTWVEPTVIHCWKGDLEDGTVFRSFGGELEGFKYDGEGMFPLFKEGEESIVFLKSFPQGLFPLSHGFGKKTIVQEQIKETRGFEKKTSAQEQSKENRGFEKKAIVQDRIKETKESVEQFIKRLEGALQ